MMKTLASCCLAAVLLTSPDTHADNPLLSAGIQAYENFEYKQALSTLQKAARHPESTQAETAKVYLYLGFVRMTLGDRKQAQEEFARAIRTEYHLALPPDLSPKIEATFNKVKKTIPPPLKKPGKDDQVSVSGDKKPPRIIDRPPPAPRERVLTWIFTGVGAAAMAGGATFGLLASDARKDFDAQPYADEADKLISTIESRSLVANILFGAGSTCLVAALVLFFTEGQSPGNDPTTKIELTPGGVQAVFRF